MNYFEESKNLHRRLKGKIRVQTKMGVRSKEDLSLVYSPGVAEPCRDIHARSRDVVTAQREVHAGRVGAVSQQHIPESRCVEAG